MFAFTAESQRTLRNIFLFVGRYRQAKSSYPGWKDFLPKAGGLRRIGISSPSQSYVSILEAPPFFLYLMDNYHCYKRNLRLLKGMHLQSN
jgi:hypothetical protein